MEEYYRSHWAEIDADRLERYDGLLQWVPQMEPLLEGLDLQEGLSVVDYGCGPGWVSLELARRVGAGGRVYACDLNPDMLKMGEGHAREAGLHERLSWLHVPDDRVPLEDGSADRAFCKNVLEYVPSIAHTVGELRRVLRPGGLLRLIDSDWDMLVVEPAGARFDEMMRSARHAFNDARAGRHLHSAVRDAGLEDVKVRMLGGADVEGRMMTVIQNMASYAVEAGYPEAEADAVIQLCREAIDAGTFLGVLPQFIVTGRAP